MNMKYLDIYSACLSVTEGKKIDSFVDLGSRRGESYEKFGKSRDIKEYTFVEPSPRCVPHIKKIVETDPTKFRLVEGVLGTTSGEITFHQLENDDDQSGNLFSDRKQAYGSSIPCVVKVYDYRQLFSDPIDFVKCNIEGAEYQLIEDGFFNMVDSFVMEVHNQHVAGKTYLDAIEGLKERFNLEIWGKTNYKYCFINGNKKS